MGPARRALAGSRHDDLISCARFLRQRYARRGEIRATGDQLWDRLPFLEGCVVDSAEIEAAELETALASSAEIGVRMQPDRRRRARRAPARA